MSFQAVKNAWYKRVDGQLLQIVENFQGLVSNCQIEGDDPVKIYRESLQLKLHADNIKSSISNLLNLSSEIRWAHLTENREEFVLEDVTTRHRDSKALQCFDSIDDDGRTN